MYHHAKRPTPLLYGIAGSVCAIAVVADVARVLDNYTSFTLRQPFDSISFVLALACTLGGPAMLAWLRGTYLRQRVAALTAENKELREDRKRIDQLVEAIRRTDEQVEVNTVLLRRLAKKVDEQQIPVGDTQPIARLHSINGGGGA